ncbi:multidrug and toxin extrusion protein 2-like isoform X2 [Phacochoerus africanus]|uniref:multidrug and toxin extrusion protein 2-like isoform X2 n=1 Tax=Phacochoerus africanus TaxID=41426 RepID=UPI001FD9B3E2|nr:multidrug and toxin extrusion protein 2-like isoform X2 [Phacochoerus africanus]
MGFISAVPGRELLLHCLFEWVWKQILFWLQKATTIQLLAETGAWKGLPGRCPSISTTRLPGWASQLLVHSSSPPSPPLGGPGTGNSPVAHASRTLPSHVPSPPRGPPLILSAHLVGFSPGSPSPFPARKSAARDPGSHLPSSLPAEFAAARMTGTQQGFQTPWPKESGSFSHAPPSSHPFQAGGSAARFPGCPARVPGRGPVGGAFSITGLIFPQSFGGRNLKRVGVILQRGILILLLCCLPCWAVFINTESLLRLLKQDPEVSRMAQIYVMTLIPSLPATFLFQLQAKYLQNQGIILPQVITGIVANVLNVGMNALLLSALDLGMQGSAWANTTSQFFLCALLFLYLRWKKIHVDTWGGWTMDCFQEWGSFIQLAIPSMFMVCIEWWTFEVGTFLAGLISVTELGAQAVVYELVTAAYTVPLGFGVAASVRVGNALGAGNPEQARHAGVTVLLCAGVCALVISTVLAALKDVVAYAFTRDKAIISLVSRVMPIFAPFHLFDALAGTSGGVLRGTGKQKMGAFSNAIGYYVFGFPLGVSLMFAAHHGIIGLWSGLTVCVSLQTLFYLVHIWRTDWTSAAQQAQVRAGLRGVRAAEPTGTEPPILEKDGPRGVILPDVVRPESQATQLMGTEGSGQDAVPTVGEVLTGGQLLLYRGLACVLAVATLVAGIAVRLLLGRG